MLKEPSISESDDNIESNHPASSHSNKKKSDTNSSARGGNARQLLGRNVVATSGAGGSSSRRRDSNEGESSVGSGKDGKRNSLAVLTAQKLIFAKGL